MLPDLGKCALLALLTVALPMGVRAQDNGLVLYGAGSLREAMTDMATLFSRKHRIAVHTEFGASGRMRERIEAGDKVDVFTSADIGHAAKLVAEAKASVMAMFAQRSLSARPGQPRFGRQRWRAQCTPRGWCQNRRVPGQDRSSG
jgi:molybdate transport system substrate-binding protein